MNILAAISATMLSALILSGGLGSRMGRDKGLVELGRVPLVKRVADVLSSIADEVVVSIAKGRTRAYSRCLGDGFRFVEDQKGGIGPIEGLVCGLGIAEGDCVLICPCDTPFLKREVCEAIVRAAVGRDGAVPKTGEDFVEPLHAAYKKAPALNAFRQVLSRGERAPTLAFHHMDIAYIDERAMRALDPDLLSFWNINSPEDLQRAEDQLARLR